MHVKKKKKKKIPPNQSRSETNHYNIYHCLHIFYMKDVGWYEQGSFSPAPRRLSLSGAYNDPFWHFALSVSILKLHNTAPLHLTSPYNVPSVETEEGFTKSRPVAVVLLKASALWLDFPEPFDIFTQSPSPSPFFSGFHKDERDVQSMCLPACQSEFNSWQMQGFLVMCCIWFSMLPLEDLRKAKELGGKTHWTEKEWHSRGWQEEKVVRSAVKRCRKGRREEVTGWSRNQKTWCEEGRRDRRGWIFHQKRNFYKLFSLARLIICSFFFFLFLNQ